jgi:hypothetical protein
MGHRFNVWAQRLLAPAFVIAAWILFHFGFSGLKTVAVLLPIYIAVMLGLIMVDPGPRTKAFVESLRNRAR